MKTLASWAPAPNLTVTAVEPGEPDWIVSVDSRAAEQDRPSCVGMSLKRFWCKRLKRGIFGVGTALEDANSDAEH